MRIAGESQAFRIEGLSQRQAYRPWSGGVQDHVNEANVMNGIYNRVLSTVHECDKDGIRMCCGVMVRMGDDEVGVVNHMPPFSLPADDDAELRQRSFPPVIVRAK